MLPLHVGDKEYRPGWKAKEALFAWLRLIFSEKTSRRLFGFLLLNLSFAFVELLYGVWTNSLGLISDSFHMFFDCTALLAGLVASVISRWRANEAYSYGYVRAEIMAGFVNGLFLLFIAFFIFSEAVERLVEPPEVKHERLFLVSVLGFLVNMVGIFAFQHGHSHGGHGHSHSAGGHGHSDGVGLQDHSYSPSYVTTEKHSYTGYDQAVQETHRGHGHSHESHGHSHESKSHGHESKSHGHESHGHSHESHGHSHESHGHSNKEPAQSFVGHDDHGHSHGGHVETPLQVSQNQIMHGVFLHILADTLGSVGVIISAILIYYFGWMIADPICSMMIATLIGFSVLPLLRDSIGILMQRTPRELEPLLPGCYQRVSQLEGVYSVQDPHFWTLSSEVFVGAVKVEVANNADTRYILSQTHNIFTQAGVRQLCVQIDIAPM
ncbi:zinc transporter 7-like [Gigantopelta aegis]|uniref:zinc transporter 7-like n=1 Tax=Gigantopelta aegis TaxID=1735272 RepID=UPI001B8886DA|nr:zinc transporter 7-like [Gigantopelta aegis]